MAVSESFIGTSFLIQIGDPKPNCIYFAGGFFSGNEMSKTEWITLITQQTVVSYPAWRNKDRNYALQGSFCASFMEREGIKSGDLLLLEYAGKRRFEVHILSSNVWDASPMWVGREGRMMAEHAFHRNVQICGVLSHESDDDEVNMVHPSASWPVGRVFAMRIEDVDGERKELPTVMAASLEGAGTYKCQLQTSNSRPCKVEIEVDPETRSAAFCSGWRTFLNECACPRKGDILVFRHRAKCRFHVEVQSPERIEGNYLAFYDSDIGQGHPPEFHQPDHNGEGSKGHNEAEDAEDVEDVFDPITFKARMQEDFFEKLPIPGSFVNDANLRKKQSIWLCFCGGRYTKISISEIRGKLSWGDRAWSEFCMANNIKVNDMILFTLEQSFSDDRDTYIVASRISIRRATTPPSPSF